MYACGKMPDHVTRYTHRHQSRWLTPPTPYRATTAAVIQQNLIILFSVAGLIAFGVMILQTM